jgi:predicted dehydrogenase
VGVGKAIRLAVIGAGYMAREHLRAFSLVPGVSLAGIHSRTEKRARDLAAEFSMPHVCGSIESLYDITQADLVVVAVPIAETQGTLESVFRFPWKVLVEKPAGHDPETAEALCTLAESLGRQAHVALNRRYYASTRRVLAALGQSGERRFVRIQDQEDLEEAARGGYPANILQNWMYANSIHLTDLFRVFCRGEPVLVTNTRPWNPSEPGVVISHIRFDSGDEGLYEGYWNAPGPWSVSIVTPERRWEMRPLEQAFLQERGQRSLQPLELGKDDSECKPGLLAQARDMVAAVRGEAHSIPTLLDALQSMRLTERIFAH